MPVVKKGNASFLNSYRPTQIPAPLKKPSNNLAIKQKKASINSGSQMSEQALRGASYMTAQPLKEGDKTFITIEGEASLQTLDQ